MADEFDLWCDTSLSHAEKKNLELFIQQLGAGVSLVRYIAIASRLAPTKGPAVYAMLMYAPAPCGSELARDGHPTETNVSNVTIDPTAPPSPRKPL